MEILSKVETGRRVESRAQLWYLEHRPGARLLARNWRCRGGEIDLVFEESRPGAVSVLVFVEVRFRDSASAWETPLESVGSSKVRRLRRAMGLYLTRYSGPAGDLRLDILEWDGHEWRHHLSVI